jgi:sulfate transport system permease protein
MSKQKKTKARGVLPGFGLSMGYTLVYMSLIVLIPLSTIFLKTTEMGWERFWSVVTDPRAVASYKLTFGASLAASLVNAVFGLLVAWVLVRYSFPGRGLVDALVDLPFALPTAVGGIALTAAYSQNGWIGQYLEKFSAWVRDQAVAYNISGLQDYELKAAFTPLGITIALIFIGLPFVVRTVQPVLQEMETEVEEAAMTLGASRGQTFRRVIVPHVMPALITGFALAFARSVGEYGSVVFIAGNMPMKTEITSLLIITKLEQYDYPGATAIAVVMLVASFTLLLLINGLQRWSAQRYGAA